VHRPFARNATVRCLEAGGEHLSEFCVIEFFDFLFIFRGIEKGTISRCFVTLKLLFSGVKSSVSMNLAPENQDMMKVLVILKVS